RLERAKYELPRLGSLFFDCRLEKRRDAPVLDELETPGFDLELRDAGVGHLFRFSRGKSADVACDSRACTGKLSRPGADRGPQPLEIRQGCSRGLGPAQVVAQRESALGAAVARMRDVEHQRREVTCLGSKPRQKSQRPDAPVEILL